MAMSCFVVGAADTFGVQDGDRLESAFQSQDTTEGRARDREVHNRRQTLTTELRRPRGVVFSGVGKCTMQKGYVRGGLHVHAVGSQSSFQLFICERVPTVSPSGVGEPERQLQPLFEEAKSSQPRVVRINGHVLTRKLRSLTPWTDWVS